MSNQFPARVPENAPGDFYVEANLCLRCCLPHGEAPDLMNDSELDFEECYFRRQPHTAVEVEQAINAILVSEIDALHYGGTDPVIIRRLYELDHGHCCDHKVDQS